MTTLLVLGISDSTHASDPAPIGSVGIRIAQIPAEVANHPYADAYIVSRVQSGTPKKQRLEVFNTSSQEISVELYPGLATFIDGNFLVGNGKEGNTLTNWTSISPKFLKLKPRESKYFIVTISPPQDASSIQQFGVIWAEVKGISNVPGIASISRVGIRMYIPVGDAPDIKITEPHSLTAANEIVVRTSIISAYLLKTTGVVFFIFLLLSGLYLILNRRRKSDRKYRKENEKRLEAQWKQERDRRRKIWDKRKNARNSRRHEDNHENYPEEDPHHF